MNLQEDKIVIAAEIPILKTVLEDMFNSKMRSEENVVIPQAPKRKLNIIGAAPTTPTITAEKKSKHEFSQEIASPFTSVFSQPSSLSSCSSSSSVSVQAKEKKIAKK